MGKINQIIEFLKTQPNCAVQWKDEPYMQFAGEWQDWSFSKPGASRLILGYWLEVNGDMCGDPNLTFDMVDGDIMEVQIEQGYGAMKCDAQFAVEFVQQVWERHFISRL